MIALLFITFALFIIVGTPIAFGMGLSALFVLVAQDKVPLLVALQRMFVGIDSLPLLAVPFFILAGSLMERGGISQRLVRFALSLVGHLRGGLAMAAVVASMIFAGISGSSAADTSAVGSIMMPAMIRKGYKKGFVASLQACAGTIGPMIPPSILMIIYGSITGLSIGALFLAGIVPGVLVGLGLMVGSYLYARKEGLGGEARATLREIGRNFWESFWALLLPLIIIGGTLTGKFTATEAGMIAVIYALIIGLFVYKELRLSQLPRILAESAEISATLMFLAATASLVAWVLAREDFPGHVVNILLSISTNPQVVMFLIIVFFLILGMFVETLSAMIIFVPVMAPLAQQFGFDPIHFATVIIVTLLIGQVTPPVGVLLSLTSAMVRTTINECIPYIIPLVAIMIIVLLIVAYAPDLVMYIPRLLFTGQG